MSYDEIKNRLNDIKIENYIWIIYLIIIFLSWYSNSVEKNYFLTGSLDSREKYQKSLILIFSILVIIYLYFLEKSYIDIKNLNFFDNKKKVSLSYLSFISSLLITISGLIYLYIAYQDENIDVELAFN